MNKRIIRLLRRDNYKCGIHTGGCGEDIKRNEATKDHIIPKDYVKTRDNSREFIGDWNYQPMHKRCNEEREGQIIDKPEFKCKCHGVYVDEQGARWVMYKEGKNWKKVKYWSEKPNRDYTIPPVQKEAMNRVIIVPGRSKNQAGVSIFKPGAFGHMFYPMGFYERLEQNGFELERTEQWEKLEAEAETFARHYMSDGGESLKWERAEQSVYTAAKFVYWSWKAQSKMPGNKGNWEAMKLLKQKVNYERVGEYPAIKKVAAYCIEGGTLIYKETSPVVGSIVFNQQSTAEKLIGEGQKYFMNGENNKAEKILNKVVQEHPKYASGWALRGQIRAISGNLERAHRDLTKAIDLQEMAVFYALRAEINRQMGSIKQAKIDIERALAVDEKLGEDNQKYKSNLVSTETGKPMKREAVVKLWREIKTRIREDEQREEYMELWKEAREHLAKGRWKEAINKCEDMFERYKREGGEKFAERMKEYKDEARAEFYWMRIIARLSLEKGFLNESCRLAQSMLEDGGFAVEQEMAKEIYEVDLDDFQMLTEKVKRRTSRMVDRLIEEGRLVKTQTAQKKNVPEKRWQLVRPLHGKD
ncbi:MAG: hypothetical protein OXU50_04300 [Gammaproteobacteria bacterium]|nr:hypothetical protein [Gammaproteobacteria bacterium]